MPDFIMYPLPAWGTMPQNVDSIFVLHKGKTFRYNLNPALDALLVKAFLIEQGLPVILKAWHINNAVEVTFEFYESESDGSIQLQLIIDDLEMRGIF